MSRRIVISERLRRAARRALYLGWTCIYWHDRDKKAKGYRSIDIRVLAELPLKGTIDLATVPVRFSNNRPVGALYVVQALALVRKE